MGGEGSAGKRKRRASCWLEDSEWLVGEEEEEPHSSPPPTRARRTSKASGSSGGSGGGSRKRSSAAAALPSAVRERQVKRQAVSDAQGLLLQLVGKADVPCVLGAAGEGAACSNGGGNAEGVEAAGKLGDW